MSVERLRELEAAATPGPWVASCDHGGWDVDAGPADHVAGTYDGSAARREANARLIAAARNALPALLDLAEAVRSSHAAEFCFDTCGSALMEGAPCSCGCEAIRNALARLNEVVPAHCCGGHPDFMCDDCREVDA